MYVHHSHIYIGDTDLSLFKGITIDSENHGQHNFRPYKGMKESATSGKYKLLIIEL